MDEADLWFESLYLKHAYKLVKITSCVLGSAVAEDIVQDVFLSLLLHREKLMNYKRPDVWLYITLRNRIGNELQRAGYRRETQLGPEHEDLVGDDGEFERLEDGFPPGLTPKERQLLTWFYEENLSCQEIAERLQSSVHACETSLYRARNRYKELIENK